MRAAGSIVMGRRTYELMAQFWPTQSARQQEPYLAERMTELPKIVFSRTLDSSTWKNTKFVRRPVAEMIREEKQGSGGSILILGQLDHSGAPLEGAPRGRDERPNPAHRRRQGAATVCGVRGPGALGPEGEPDVQIGRDGATVRGPPGAGTRLELASLRRCCPIWRRSPFRRTRPVKRLRWASKPTIVGIGR